MAGVFDLRVIRIVEEPFQIPGEFVTKIGIGMALDGKIAGSGHVLARSALAVGGAQDLKLRRVGFVDVANSEYGQCVAPSRVTSVCEESHRRA